MKLMSSGRHFSAAMMRSPSFSRSSSSMITTMRPAASSVRISSTLLSLAVTGCAPEHALHIARHHVHLQVHLTARLIIAEDSVTHRVRDDVDVEDLVLHRVHREAHAIDADGSLVRDIAFDGLGHLDVEAHRAGLLAA